MIHLYTQGQLALDGISEKYPSIYPTRGTLGFGSEFEAFPDCKAEDTCMFQKLKLFHIAQLRPLTPAEIPFGIIKRYVICCFIICTRSILNTVIISGFHYNVPEALL